MRNHFCFLAGKNYLNVDTLTVTSDTQGMFVDIPRNIDEVLFGARMILTGKGDFLLFTAYNTAESVNLFSFFVKGETRELYRNGVKFMLEVPLKRWFTLLAGVVQDSTTVVLFNEDTGVVTTDTQSTPAFAPYLTNRIFLFNDSSRTKATPMGIQDFIIGSPYTPELVYGFLHGGLLWKETLCWPLRNDNVGLGCIQDPSLTFSSSGMTAPEWVQRRVPKGTPKRWL